MVAALVGCSSGTAEPSDADDDLGTLRVVTTVPNSLQFIGVQAADTLGTWEGTGLKVEVVDGTSPNSGQFLAGGQADIAMTDGIRGLANIGEGLDATFVAGTYKPWPQLVIVRADYPGDTFADLKGANFGISGTGSAGHYATHKLAEAEGWSESDYTITPLGNLQAITAALQSGAIDAFTWSADTGFDLEEKGIARVLGPTAEVVGPNLFQGFVVMNNVIEERPEALRVFFENYFSTIERVQQEPESAVEVMVGWGVGQSAAERTVEQDVPELSTDGKVTAENLRGLEEAAEFATGNVVDADEHFVYWQDLLK
ncbi:ABC transporter substrate-binding protein [Microbacterium sp. NPDC058342]|uniref:ABC transporter substrate-binding protein n=1 Tax=Microbacterium sp. NPDC058342 TaxID=3346454 RepID=UPI0036562036